MALKRVALEIGMGTDIRGGDYTKAAVRALRDALWHNSLTVATVSELCHSVSVVEGGLEIANEAGTDKTVIAQAAAIVRLDL